MVSSQPPPSITVTGKSEQSVASSQAGSVAAQPRSCGTHSWQSQPLTAVPPSAKRHCIEPDPSLSQSYSDSSSKALFNQFIQYVKRLYKRSPVEKRTEVLKLKTPGKMFINLACIDRKTEGLRTEYNEITEAMVRDGNVDVIKGRKCPIDMNAIAANLPEEVLEKVILVEGAPGVGKSTFAWEFCRRWERGEIAQQYDLVLLLPLRDDRISKAKSLKDLIYHHSEKVRAAVVSELESCLGVNVLLILEGYDELPDECRCQSSLFLELINGQQLPFATLLITSRPWATCDVHRKFGHRIFQHIEVLGFTKEQITVYIRSSLSVEEALDLEECLRKQSTVRMCMYIPLNCAIVVTVYLECKDNGVALPTTLSGFYETLSFAILLRYLRAIDISSEPIESFHNLPAVLKGKFCSLCQLAYDSIAGAGEVKLIFTDLPKDFDGLGFMDSVFELYETQKAVASHNFLHLTFQKFLAAVHISNMEAEQQLQHYKRYEDGRLRVVLRFLAGITKLKDFNTPSSFVGLLDQPTKCGYTAIDYTIRPHVCSWVHEALGKEIIKRAFHENVTVEFACDDLSDSAALGYCITHSCSKWVLSVSGWMEKEEIDILVDERQTSDSTGGVIVGLRGGFDKETYIFNGLSVSFTELYSIFTGLHVRLSELALKLPAKCSQISWPGLSSLQSLTINTMDVNVKTINLELDYLLPQLSLSSLTLLFNPSLLSFEDSRAVANYITNSSTLMYFHILVDCPLIEMDEIFAAIIEKEVYPIFTLEILISDDVIDNNNAEKLANYIRTTALSKLVFPHLIFSSFGALQVTRALREIPDLIADKLYFFICGPSDFLHAIQLIEYFDLIDETMFKEIDEYNVSFSFLLPDSTTAEWRFNVKGGIDDVGLQHMVEALCNKPSIKALTLTGFKVSDVRAKAFAEALNSNNILEKLDLSGNEIGIVGTEALTQAIGSNTVLKKLDLSFNNVGDVGAKAMAEALNSNNILEELDLSGTKIGIVGTEALAQAIGSNTTLKKLSLCDNDVGDDGAKALAELLNCSTILEELDLSGNKIGSVGTEALAQAIGSNTTLKKLSLSGNDVGDVGAKALAEVLNCNSILKELDLSCNKIGDVGAEAFAQAVGSNTSLKDLDLYNNDVGDVGAIALAWALHSNSSLEVLNLGWSCIGDSGAKAFAEALHHNSTITHLHLSYNRDIGEEGVHHLIQALTVNDSISENGLILDKKGSECALTFSEYRNVKHKIKWWI